MAESKNVAHVASPQGLWPSGHQLQNGKYEVVEYLSGGATSEVYKVKQRFHPGWVSRAIKRLKPEHWDNKDNTDRFLREAFVLRLFSDKHIVQVYDSFTEDDEHCFVTELAEDGNLRLFLRASRFDPVQAIDIAIDICRALNTVHSKGIIHRDVKPGNILIFRLSNNTYQAKLADFAGAYVPNSQVTEEFVGEISFGGTLQYAPIEQFNGRIPEKWFDLYALGWVLFEMITGKRPPQHTDRPPEFNESTPPLLFFQNEGIPDPLSPVIQRSLSKDPNTRFATAQDLQRTLEDLRASVSVEAIREGVTRCETLLDSEQWEDAIDETEKVLASLRLLQKKTQTDTQQEKVDFETRLLMCQNFARAMRLAEEDRFEEAVENLDRVKGLNKDYRDVADLIQVLKALHLNQMANYDLALAELAELTKTINPPVVGTIDDIYADIRKRAAENMLGQRNYGEVIRHLRPLINKRKVDPKAKKLWVETHYKIGRLTHIKGEYEQAVPYWEEVLKHDPNHADGRAKERLEECFQWLVKNRPDRLRWLSGLIRLHPYSFKFRWLKARELLRQKTDLPIWVQLVGVVAAIAACPILLALFSWIPGSGTLTPTITLTTTPNDTPTFTVAPTNTYSETISTTTDTATPTSTTTDTATPTPTTADTATPTPTTTDTATSTPTLTAVSTLAYTFTPTTDVIRFLKTITPVTQPISTPANTRVPTQTSTPELVNTPVTPKPPPRPTNTPEPTNTPVPPEPTNTPVPPGPTNTPVSP